MRYVLPIERATDVERVGGKAHSLGRLVEWGFEVPYAYVIPADVYEAVVGEPQIRSLIADAGDDDVGPIREAIQVVAVDPELKSELIAVWRELETATPGPLAVACRSSAIGEDSSTASFAGQHDTVLGITSFDGLLDGVRQCWGSAWSDQAAAYRRRSGAPSPAMAVVVQRMARADVSGVAFSVNPVTGDESQVVINSSYGLGEMIVSGSITPDTFVVDRESLVLTSSEVSPDKTRMLVLTESGGVEARPVSPVLAMTSSLDESQVGMIANAVLRAEEMAGLPQDIEWAYEGGRLLMLQARPVTGLGV